jgi:hypothetical protein
MTSKFELAAARIAREVPVTEACLDDALISVSSLIATMVQARKDTGVAASTGQSTIVRLAKAQMALVTVSNDVLRAHKDLAGLAEVHAGADLHECPRVAGRADNVTRLKIAS